MVLTDMVLTDIYVMAKKDESEVSNTNTEDDQPGDAPICIDGQPALPLLNCPLQNIVVRMSTCFTHLGIDGTANLPTANTVFICSGPNHICCIVLTPSVVPPLPSDDPV